MPRLFTFSPPPASAMPPSPSLFSLITIFIATILTAAHSQHTNTTSSSYANCNRTFTCGTIRNIIYPFTGGDRPSYCGLPEFTLTCRDNNVTELTQNSVAYRVLRLDQAEKFMILAPSLLYDNPCPSEFYNSTLNSTLFRYEGPENEVVNLIYGCNGSAMSVKPQNHFKCSSSISNFTDSYYIIGPVSTDPILRFIVCSVSIRVPVLKDSGERLTGSRISLGEALMLGFSVKYNDPYQSICSKCNGSGGQCGFDRNSGQPVCICDDKLCPSAPAPPPEATRNASPGRIKLKLILLAGVSSAAVVLISIILFTFNRWKYMLNLKGKTRNHKDIELFLKKIENLTPRRYNYSDLKKMTNSFSDNIGKGGFASVYRGKLPDGRLVAVKILKESKGNGEEFINEVASISRTSHVNVVTLLGFCFEGSKRALIYEFMPNGSLEKFICCNSSIAEHQLGWEKLFQIAVGIAQGIEYLHQGCNTRILHFDIKPHNILLDEDFIPKISDFGLAKLCPNRSSIVSMLGARGTIGYIAPEIVYRNFGEISYKSDVYSYGMMVLEMVGETKNTDVRVDHSSEKYFPDWIYKHLEQNSELDFNRVANEDELLKIRKMVIVGLWCIQTDPTTRPSMSRVIEMLEGNMEFLQIPPKPYFLQPRAAENFSTTESSVTLS